MTYGHSPRVLAGDGAVINSASAENSRSTARSWRALDADLRLALIERALHPANDIIDGFPLAL